MTTAVRVKSVEIIDEVDDVYDIWNRAADVDDSNFVANGMVVHNCIPDYVKRRDDTDGEWKKHEHPDVVRILAATHGIIVWQEQLQALWQEIADFTSPEAQEARKIISKKWRDQLKLIEERWLAGASKKLGREAAVESWNKQVTFGRYAFNKCLDKDTVLADPVTGHSKSVEEWYKSGRDAADGRGGHPDFLPALTPDDDVVADKCLAIHDTGPQEVLEIEFDNGQVERVTVGHKFLCGDGRYHTVGEIYERGLDVVDARPGRPDNQARRSTGMDWMPGL